MLFHIQQSAGTSPQKSLPACPAQVHYQKVQPRVTRPRNLVRVRIGFYINHLLPLYRLNVYLRHIPYAEPDKLNEHPPRR